MQIRCSNYDRMLLAVWAVLCYAENWLSLEVYRRSRLGGKADRLAIHVVRAGHE